MPNELTETSKVTSIQSFQPLQAGQYWRSRCDIPEEDIDAGTVLLIESLRWVEDKIHTVILRAHPSQYGKTFYVQRTDTEGNSYKTTRQFREHRFLFDDFTAKFEFEPDAEQIREDELKHIQDQLQQMQNELAFGPPSRDQFVKQLEAGTEPSGESTSIVPTTFSAEMSLTTAIETGITKEKIATFRTLAEREAKVAALQADWIKGKVDKISETLQDMAPYLQEKAAAALAHTEDIRNYVKGLGEGIESLELYVGTDVTVEEIRKGQSAPEDVPLSILQSKLYMDQEFAIWANIGEQFDFRNEEQFFDALRANESLIQQVFPTERCVLVMAVRHTYINYGDRWDNYHRNAINKLVFLLIRDGENIYRVFSPVESHMGADRLFPATNESNEKFRGFDGSTITFQDVRYTDRLNEHEKMALHYKRFLILLCGLDHRLGLFGTFYPQEKSFDFVKAEFQERYFRFIHDDDGEGMLPLENRISFADWLEQVNEYVRPGSRVMCYWSKLMSQYSAPGAYRSSNSPDYRTADPVNRFDVATVYLDTEGNLMVDALVKRYSYRSGDSQFKAKVNLTYIIKNGLESRAFGFLCLDNVNPEELDWYIHDRKSRESYLEYIELFKTTSAFVRKEHEEEQPTRQRMKKALEEGGIASGNEADDIVQRTVVAWRADHKGAPLPQFDGDTPPSQWKKLLNQMFLLAGDAQQRIASIEVYVSQEDRTPLRLVASGSARLAVYMAPRPEEQDNRMTPFEWTLRLELEPKKDGSYKKLRSSWVLLPKLSASETVIHEWPLAKNWIFEESPHVFRSPEEKSELMEAVDSFRTRIDEFVRAIKGDDATLFESLFADWKRVRSDLNRKGRNVQEPNLYLPFGLFYKDSPSNPQMQYLAFGTTMPHVFLYFLAKTDEQRSRVEAAYINQYQRKDLRRQEFREELRRYSNFKFHLISSKASYKEWGISGTTGSNLYYYDSQSPTLDGKLKNWIEYKTSARDKYIWIPEETKRLAQGDYFEAINKVLFREEIKEKFRDDAASAV